MNSKISVLLADDHPLILRGVQDLLLEKGYNVVATASDGSEALTKIKELCPDISLLDIEMPQISGLDIAKECKSKGIRTKIILLSYHKEIAYVARAKELNIRGYIVKDDAMKSVEECIGIVDRGGFYFSEPLDHMDVTVAKDFYNKLSLLSPSETKILTLISEGYSTDDIADLLFISKRTVEKHRSNIISKLDINGKPNELLRWTMVNRDFIGK